MCIFSFFFFTSLIYLTIEINHLKIENDSNQLQFLVDCLNWSSVSALVIIRNLHVGWLLFFRSFAASICCDLSNYFFRFFIGGRPLSNSDVDKLIDFETNLPKPLLWLAAAAGRFIPFFFTVFGSVMRSDFLLPVDLKWVSEIPRKTSDARRKRNNTQTGNWNFGPFSCCLVLFKWMVSSLHLYNR